MEFGTDGKVAKKIVDTIKGKNTNSSVMIVSYDEENEKSALFGYVTEAHLAAGLNAKEWCDFCIAECGGGKGGGRALEASANIPGGREIHEKAALSANAFARKI